MANVAKIGHYLTTRSTTGPQDLILLLDLEPEWVADPFVTAFSESKYGRPDDDTVRSAVLAGTARANAEFGTNWHPFEIRYSYSGYDLEQCGLMRQAACEIVKELVIRGLEGITIVPVPSGGAWGLAFPAPRSSTAPR